MRRLVCPPCGAEWEKCLHLYGNTHNGRIVRGRAKHPQMENRVMHVNGDPIPLGLDAFQCDDCNKDIKPGDKAAAVSMFRRGGEMPAWEGEFLES